ncbi:hypothetical protein SLEP1_g11004 [Rubroshorea leprosula]|uniref:Uncharacterized protein n=1 Tax=Rubroshorea leprosula TaxID=152421 RepID=A0AAV5IJ66_9ROSI|nr:hypothetical protein SLEP1_g11004 [Rubroshorea leprosula]
MNLHLICRSKCDERGLFACEEEKLSQENKRRSSFAQLSRHSTMSAMSVQEAKKCRQNTSLSRVAQLGSNQTVQLSSNKAVQLGSGKAQSNAPAR